MKIALLFLALSLAAPLLSTAQMSQLSVYKANGELAMRIYPGETIELRTSRGWQSDELVMLLNDSLIVGDHKLALSEIQKIKRVRLGLAAASANLMVAGTIWPGIVAINGLSAGVRPLVTNRALLSSGLMLGSGLLLWKWSRTTYKTQEPGRLRIVHFKFDLPNQELPHEPNPVKSTTE